MQDEKVSRIDRIIASISVQMKELLRSSSGDQKELISLRNEVRHLSYKKEMSVR